MNLTLYTLQKICCNNLTDSQDWISTIYNCSPEQGWSQLGLSKAGFDQAVLTAIYFCCSATLRGPLVGLMLMTHLVTAYEERCTSQQAFSLSRMQHTFFPLMLLVPILCSIPQRLLILLHLLQTSSATSFLFQHHCNSCRSDGIGYFLNLLSSLLIPLFLTGSIKPFVRLFIWHSDEVSNVAHRWNSFSFPSLGTRSMQKSTKV